VQRVVFLVRLAVLHSGAMSLDVRTKFPLMVVVDGVYITAVLVHTVETLWRVENLAGLELLTLPVTAGQRQDLQFLTV
tara:strand:- start:488 stop:721 length:234 start_codon:yes stop_codon:yes gene_type:complete